jgi:hypothetical protein
MKYGPHIHHRRSIRPRGYDYSSPGAYSVTICTQDRLCLFGDVVERRMVKNPTGEFVHSAWWGLASDYPFLDLDAFQVMPNHIHGVLVIRPGDWSSGQPGEPRVRARDREDRSYAHGTAAASVGRAVQAFKSRTAGAYSEARGSKAGRDSPENSGSAATTSTSSAMRRS